MHAWPGRSRHTAAPRGLPPTVPAVPRHSGPGSSHDFLRGAHALSCRVRSSTSEPQRQSCAPPPASTPHSCHPRRTLRASTEQQGRHSGNPALEDEDEAIGTAPSGQLRATLQSSALNGKNPPEHSPQRHRNSRRPGTGPRVTVGPASPKPTSSFQWEQVRLPGLPSTSGLRRLRKATPG